MEGKAKKIMVRFGFSDSVYSLKDAMDNNVEICSCNSYVVGYEDEDGEECEQDGTYLNKTSKNDTGS